jgi:hypothetical protein
MEKAPHFCEAFRTAYGIPCLTASRRQGTRITSVKFLQPFTTSS